MNECDLKLQGSDIIAATETSSNNVTASSLAIDQKPLVKGFQKIFAAIKMPVEGEAALHTSDLEEAASGNLLPATGNDLPVAENELIIFEKVENHADLSSFLAHYFQEEPGQNHVLMASSENIVPVKKTGDLTDIQIELDSKIKSTKIYQENNTNSGTTEISHESSTSKQLFSGSVQNHFSIQKEQVDSPKISKQVEVGFSIVAEKTSPGDTSEQNTKLQQTSNIQQVRPEIQSGKVEPAVDNQLHQSDIPRLLSTTLGTTKEVAREGLLTSPWQNQENTVKQYSIINTEHPFVTGVTAKVNHESMQRTPASEQVELPAAKQGSLLNASVNIQGSKTVSDVAANKIELTVAAERNQQIVNNKIVVGLPVSVTKNHIGISTREALIDKYSAVVVSDTSSLSATPLSAPSLSATPLLVTHLSYQSTPGMLSGHQSAASFELNTGNHGWDRALGKNMLMMAKDGVQKATIQMKPAELGLLNIQVSIQQDQLNVNITSNLAVTRDLLESALPRLREQFSQQGFSQLNVDISDQHQAGTGKQDFNEQPAMAGQAFSADSGQISEEKVIRQQAHNNLLDAFA